MSPSAPPADEDDVGEYASPACLMHEFREDYFGSPAEPKGAEACRPGIATRLVPERALPRYAYLPGRSLPHPIRHPAGHSHGLADADHVPADAFAWGVDLFNNGYYWEAHEAWEPLWRAAHRGGVQRAILKALILLAAVGVKLRERKAAAAARHAGRAAHLLEGPFREPLDPDLRQWIVTLLGHVQKLSRRAVAPAADPANPRVVFLFALGLPAALQRSDGETLGRGP